MNLFNSYGSDRTAIGCFLAAIDVLFAISDYVADSIISKFENSGTYLLT